MNSTLKFFVNSKIFGIFADLHLNPPTLKDATKKLGLVDLEFDIQRKVPL